MRNVAIFCLECADYSLKVNPHADKTCCFGLCTKSRLLKINRSFIFKSELLCYVKLHIATANYSLLFKAHGNIFTGDLGHKFFDNLR